jgi:magnesium transporter
MLDISLIPKGNKGKKEGTLKHLNNKKEVWVDCINPSKKELKEISILTGIPVNDLKECLDPGERPRIAEYKNYSLLVFRVPYYTSKTNIKTTPISIFISKAKKSVLTIRLKDTDSFNRVKNKLESEPDLQSGSLSHLIFRIIDENINEFFTVLDKVSDKIEDIEDNVIQNPKDSLRSDIMHTKRTLIYFSKDLVGNREVVAGIEKEYVIHISKKDIKEFRNVYNDIVQLIDMVSTYRDILTGAMDIYLSSISNNMNAIMKTLTIISAFVMIPTLISGIYGMNFIIMPELRYYRQSLHDCIHVV